MTDRLGPIEWGDLAARLRPFIARRLPADTEVEDVLQEALAKVLRGLPGLSDPRRFEAWTWRITRNAIADHLRERRSRPTPRAGAGHDLEAPPSEGDEDAVARALARVLPLFVALLPQPYREALTLVDLRGLTHEQAARSLGLSVSGAKSRVQRARARLRAMLEACCELAMDARGKVTECRARRGAVTPPKCSC